MQVSPCVGCVKSSVLGTDLNKCSAPAEMGDRLGTPDLGRNVAAAVPRFWGIGEGRKPKQLLWTALPPAPLGGGAGSSSNTMSSGPMSTSMPSGILIHPAVEATIDMGRKLGASPLLGRGAGSPSNTMSLGLSLPPYQVAS